MLLGTVGVHTETAAQRFTTLDTLLRDLVVLCASRALAGSTSGHESAATSPLGDLTLTVDRLTGVASWRLFKDFLPDAQEGAVDQVRERMFKTCGKIRAGQAIDVRRLVRAHFSPLGARRLTLRGERSPLLSSTGSRAR